MDIFQPVAQRRFAARLRRERRSVEQLHRGKMNSGALGINPNIPKRPTFILKTTGGSATIQEGTIPAIILIVHGSMDTFRVQLGRIISFVLREATGKELALRGSICCLLLKIRILKITGVATARK
jgi:hypothetical protein